MVVLAQALITASYSPAMFIVFRFFAGYAFHSPRHSRILTRTQLGVIYLRSSCGNAYIDNQYSGFQLVAAVPNWIAEIVPPSNRGMLSDIAPIMINVG